LGKKIPRSIQEKTIKKWLEGKPRDLVARELKIGAGSVTGIIQACRRKDREFDLLRVVALQLRELGITLESLAPLLRFRQLLTAEYSETGKIIEEEEEEIDSLMEALCVFCFNGKKTVPEFANLVHGLYLIANKFGIALYDLPAYVSNLESRATAIRKEIDLLRTKRVRLLREYEITTGVIKDIVSHGPYVVGAYFDIKAQKSEIENERNVLKIELKNLKVRIRSLEIEMAKKGH
jgi:hypothetical protein